MTDPVFQDPHLPDIEDLFDAALDALSREQIPVSIVDTIIRVRMLFRDDGERVCQHEISGLVWGFVAGRYYADQMRLSPGYYRHHAHRN